VSERSERTSRLSGERTGWLSSDRGGRFGGGAAWAFASPVTAAGLGGAVALAVLLDATGVTTGGEALLAGLMTGTATLVLDASARAERRFRLRDLLESTDWLPGGVTSLAGATRQMVDEHPAPEILTEARRRLQALTEEFDELARGRVVRRADDYELLIAATDACHRRLEEVCDVSDRAGLRWWSGPVGQRYWAANLNALSRGAAIVRVFVCAGLDPDVVELVSEQSEAGVTTLVATREPSQDADRAALVVWDGRRAWEPGTAAGNVFTVNSEDLLRLNAELAGWSARARPVSA
jgi:hypothetical protein